MKRWMFFVPLAGLVVLAGLLGLRFGTVPSDTDIINRYAASYQATAGDGAKSTDCEATPHFDPSIRMVITCIHASGTTTTYFVGPRGVALPEPQGPSA